MLETFAPQFQSPTFFQMERISLHSAPYVRACLFMLLHFSLSLFFTRPLNIFTFFKKINFIVVHHSFDWLVCDIIIVIWLLRNTNIHVWRCVYHMILFQSHTVCALNVTSEHNFFWLSFKDHVGKEREREKSQWNVQKKRKKLIVQVFISGYFWTVEQLLFYSRLIIMCRTSMEFINFY